jgi:hypothetical protein
MWFCEAVWETEFDQMLSQVMIVKLSYLNFVSLIVESCGFDFVLKYVDESSLWIFSIFSYIYICYIYIYIHIYILNLGNKGIMKANLPK